MNIEEEEEEKKRNNSKTSKIFDKFLNTVKFSTRKRAHMTECAVYEVHARISFAQF